ncbi:MAG: 4-(cytidine 5'-diphospho)-2-C-methyl-D-erythritol kinase [Syntrophomonadaceae bacterium]|nr:4-(cytidine 5'-diphospho)-2-C-methyl-D-erythritol kinase [Syntrophomonadaceae bacterium]
MPDSIIIPAPAKVNLTLDIKGKRPDGYHELETVMHQINLVDIITIEKQEAGIEVVTSSDLVIDDETNLAYRAAALILEKSHCRAGVKIIIQKNIPVGAGLAGGSTDAAAVLKGIRQLFDLRLDDRALHEMGLALGSDVPFCLRGGTALATGRGEVLGRLPDNLHLNMVIVKPPYQVSTAEVYKAFRPEQVKRFPDTDAFIESWYNCDMIGICDYMENVLESVTEEQYAEIKTLKNQLVQLGALKAVMSGSGPSVLAIFDQLDSAVRAFEIMKKTCQETYIVSSYLKEEVL